MFFPAELLKKGYAVRRASWPKGGTVTETIDGRERTRELPFYIAVFVGKSAYKVSKKVLAQTGYDPDIGASSIELSALTKYVTPWVPSADDLFAEDWGEDGDEQA